MGYGTGAGRPAALGWKMCSLTDQDLPACG
jgi:hypothetical protein